MTETHSLSDLPTSERVAIAGLVVSLFVKGSKAESKAEALHAFFEQLQLPEEERTPLLALNIETADPLKFAVRLQDPQARSSVFAYLLAFALVDGRYDSRERQGLKQVAAALGIDWQTVQRAEVKAVECATSLWKPIPTEAARPGSKNRNWKIAATAIAGVALLGITGGLAAPAIGGFIGSAFLGLSGAAATSAGLATLGGGALAAGGLGMAGGTAAVAGGFAIIGGGMAAKAMAVRTAGIEEFAFEHIGGAGLHSVIGISGWLSEKDSLIDKWKPLADVAAHSSHSALRWESKHLVSLGTALGATGATQVAALGARAWARRATRFAGRRLLWPTLFLEAINLIDNPWHVAADRAEKTGLELAEQLSSGAASGRPVTLVGFSLGGRVIMHCLRALAEKESYGVVQDAILMGAAVTPTADEWSKARKVVPGRLVNAFCEKDWVLGYLYRAAQLETEVAGLGPVQQSGVTNVDVGDIVDGHLSYVPRLSTVLERVGIDCAY